MDAGEKALQHVLGGAGRGMQQLHTSVEAVAAGGSMGSGHGGSGGGAGHTAVVAAVEMVVGVVPALSHPTLFHLTLPTTAGEVGEGDQERWQWQEGSMPEV